MVFGAFTGDQLRAVSVYYLVGRTFVNGTYFSDSESQPLQVHDFVLHPLRETAATTTADLIYMGPHTGVAGIDRAKIIRGCTLITKRTHLRLNPVAALVLRLMRPQMYTRLQGNGPLEPVSAAH